MSLIRQVWLLLALTLVLAFAAAFGITVHSTRQYLETQLALKNNDTAQFLALTLSQQKGDATAMELAAYAAFGSIASATDWWLGPKEDSPRRMPSDEYVAHLTTIMVGSINGTCELLGIKIDPDLPLHEGVRRRDHVA